ncbi:MAG: permease-like cell division protein FtsX [Peptostreptococcaceae bacterium]|nr:permease-like cell division protein FtsX [Peptostreptococcaceae bacterium]
MFSSIIYNISGGFKSVWRNKNMAAASIASVASSLFILGVLLAVVLNINHFAMMIQHQFDDIQAFIMDEVTAEEITVLKSEIESLPNVSKVVFESKEMAMDKLKERWGEDAYLLEGLENPLQNSLIVELNSLKNADAVADHLKADVRVDSINYYKDVVDRLLFFSRVISIAGLALILLLFVISLFIIANTIKIVIYARRREINIMKYVGATNWFIRWPFVIEGMILGLIGASVALGFVYLLYDFIYDKLGSGTYTLIGNSMLSVDVIFDNMLSIFLSAGVGVGILGSLVSLRRHLEV